MLVLLLVIFVPDDIRLVISPGKWEDTALLNDIDTKHSDNMINMINVIITRIILDKY